MTKETEYYLIDTDNKVKVGPLSEDEIWMLSDSGDLFKFDLMESSRRNYPFYGEAVPIHHTRFISKHPLRNNKAYRILATILLNLFVKAEELDVSEGNTALRGSEDYEELKKLAKRNNLPGCLFFLVGAIIIFTLLYIFLS